MTKQVLIHSFIYLFDEMLHTSCRLLHYELHLFPLEVIYTYTHTHTYACTYTFDTATLFF